MGSSFFRGRTRILWSAHVSEGCSSVMARILLALIFVTPLLSSFFFFCSHFLKGIAYVILDESHNIDCSNRYIVYGDCTSKLF